MGNYSRMVIDLYKGCLTESLKKRQVNTDKILEVKKALASALTEARVKECPTEELKGLIEDVDYLSSLAYEHTC